ncbi:hypothetical protein AVEN_80013-1 [Araneus ventricosus]|uniref:Uncharacterized protein n=1 Tax=Araneus ventricosus TaxID=182803 RepID=A0A4Y2FPT9_ARAVE|nr:hypothetical protein AVEN_80013-1 [Araneus ventricosus]
MVKLYYLNESNAAEPFLSPVETTSYDDVRVLCKLCGICYEKFKKLVEQVFDLVLDDLPFRAHFGYSGTPHTSQRQRTISRVFYKKSPSSSGKKNGTMEKQPGVFTTFCLKSRQLLFHGKCQK